MFRFVFKFQFSYNTIGKIILISLFCLNGFFCQSDSLKKEQKIADKKKSSQTRESRIKWQKELERRKKVAEFRIQKTKLEQLKKEEEKNKKKEIKRRLAEKRKIEENKKKQAHQEKLRKKKEAALQALFKQNEISNKLKKLEYNEAFWFIEDQKLRFDTIIVEGSGNKKNKRFLMKNLMPLQFHSSSLKSFKNKYRIQKVKSFSSGALNISTSIIKNRGHYILMEVQRNVNSSPSFKLLKIRLKDKMYIVIDIFSDGENMIFMDLESMDGKLLYRRIFVQNIILQP